MTKSRELLEKGIREFRARPSFYFGLGACHVLFVWTQDMLHVFGPLLSSIAVTLLVARMHARELRVKLTPLVGLALLLFPINVLWTVLMSLHGNTSLMEPFSSAWSVPAMLFMLLAIAPWSLAVRHVVLEGKGLDQSLKLGWLECSRRISAVCGAALVMTALCALAMLSGGYGFFVVTPFGYALLKALAEPA